MPTLGHHLTMECALHEILQAASDGDDSKVASLLQGRVVGVASAQWTPRVLAPELRRFWPTWVAQGECQALHCASAAGHTEVCRLLLASRAAPAATTRQGATPLMLAAFGGHRDCVQLLLGADEGTGAADLTNRGSRDGFSALHVACCGSCHNAAAAIVAALLAAGADPHTTDRSGRTSLHYAAASHNVGVCAALLHAGAWLQVVDSNGATPLRLTAREGGALLTAARPLSPARSATLRELCWLPSVRLLWIGACASAGAGSQCLLRLLTRDVVRLLASAVIQAHCPEEDACRGEVARADEEEEWGGGLGVGELAEIIEGMG